MKFRISKEKWDTSFIVYVSLTTEVSVKMVVTVSRNISKKYARTEAVWESHALSDIQKTASSSAPLEIVSLLNFVGTITKKKITVT